MSSEKAIGLLEQRDGAISDRSVVLASDFLRRERDADQGHAPGELLEVAALIEGYLTGAYQIEYRPVVPLDDGQFSLFGQIRAVLTERPEGTAKSELSLHQSETLRERAEAMLEEKAWQLRQAKKQFRRMRLISLFLASFAMASGLLELRLCGWL